MAGFDIKWVAMVDGEAQGATIGEIEASARAQVAALADGRVFELTGIVCEDPELTLGHSPPTLWNARWEARIAEVYEPSPDLPVRGLGYQPLESRGLQETPNRALMRLLVAVRQFLGPELAMYPVVHRTVIEGAEVVRWDELSDDDADHYQRYGR